jgi:RNA polymerase sigma-70 factor (ECF subfamily)
LQEFYQLLDRVREGADGAVRQLLERYGPHVQAVVRQKLDVSMRAVFDSIDFLQDVWGSFFTGELERTSFKDPAALLKFLVSMARNKVTDEMRRRLHGGRYNLTREQSLDGSARFEASALQDGPTPADLVQAQEEWELLLQGLPFHHRRILEMLRMGHTHKEIAQELGLNEKTVRRLIHKILSRART